MGGGTVARARALRDTTDQEGPAATRGRGRGPADSLLAVLSVNIRKRM
jgi:hypothetical protein